MNTIIILSIFFFGSIIGSFLNVCIFRIPKEESIAFPPSHCGKCNSELKVKDLFPIFSYLFLKGKCRYCNEKVSIQYPIIEALTGLSFVLLYLTFGLTISLVTFMLFTALFIVIAIIDFKTQDVYDSTIICGVVFGIIGIAIEFFSGRNVDLISIALGAFVPALILAIIVWTTGAMGWGDVEIIFVAGLFLGFKLNLLNLFLSVVIGGLVACFLLITKKKGGKDSIAFGPYIALSSYITLLCGEQILTWYLSFL